VSQAAKIIII